MTKVVTRMNPEHWVLTSRPFPAGDCDKRQRGVALITALLVVAMVTVAAVSMAARQQLDIRRTANVIDTDTAYLFNRGIESWALEVLARDSLQSKVDTLDEDWASVLPPITVEGATVTGKIDDLQARFNLNNLLENNAPSQTDIDRFKRLLGILDLNPDLADAVLDWIDPDDQTRYPGGAEDTEYLAREVPYRAANRPMISVSELRLVKGVDQDVYEKLSPFVSALPSRTDINVNTASATVLRCLANNLSENDGKNLVDGRGEHGYQAVAEFLGQAILKDRGIDQKGLAVATRHFLVSGRSQIGNGRIDMYSLLERGINDGKVVVLMRGLGAI